MLGWIQAAMQQNTITDTKETEEGFKYYAKTRTVGRFNNLKGGSCTIVPPTRLKTYLPKSGWGPYVGPRGPVGGGAISPLATYLGSDGHVD